MNMIKMHKAVLLCLLFGAAQQATAQTPGGVSTGLSLWFEPKTNIISSLNRLHEWRAVGSSVTLFGTFLSSSRPLHAPGASQFSFSPYTIFDGVDDSLVTTGALAFGTGAYTIYYVASNNGPTASGWVLNLGASGTAAGFHSGSDATTASTLRSGGAVFASSANTWTNNLTPVIVRTGFNGGVSQPYYQSVNGGAEVTSVNASPNITSSKLVVGANALSSGNFWNGRVGDIIIYSGKHTASDYNKIESYLALKYGITKANNYVNSAGTTVWTTGGGYDNNIAGIIRDDMGVSGTTLAGILEKKQSYSTNGGFQPVIALNIVASTNSTNSGSFSLDGQSFVWGDDNGSITDLTRTGNSAFPFRLTRVWKTQNTGSFAEDIRVYYPVSAFGTAPASSVSLIFGTVAASLDNGMASTITQSGTVTINGVSHYVFVVPSTNIANMQFYSFTSTVYNPGGVAGSVMWVRADTGLSTAGSSVTGWANLANTTKNLNSFGSPIVNDTANVNFNPTVILRGIPPVSSSLYSDSVIIPGNSDMTRFVAFRSYNTAVANLIGGGKPVSPVADAEVALLKTASGANLQQWVAGGGGFYGNTAPFALNQPQLATSVYRESVASGTFIRVNGIQNTASTNTIGYTDARIQLGASYNVGGAINVNYIVGDIAESIIYADSLTATEIARVESYMALKYGATLGTTASAVSYLNSTGATIWTASSTYQNNVAGIGRDDLTLLNQKQSRSVSTGTTQVVMALGTVAATNKANTSTFSSDNQFLIWGDDNGSLSSFASTGITAYPFRFTRIWRTQNTGSFAQNITVYYPVSAFGTSIPSTISLIYGASAAALSSGAASTIAQSGTTTINGVNHYIFSVSSAQVGNMQFFSFTGTVPRPGGVNGLRLWLRADKGTSTVSEGLTLDTLFDQSGNGFNALAPTPSGNRPLFRTANSSVGRDFNFNPYIDLTISGPNRRGFYNTSPIYTSNNDNGAHFAYVQHSGAVDATGTTLMAVAAGTSGTSYMDQGKLYFVTNNTTIQWAAGAVTTSVADVTLRPTLYSADWTGATSTSKVLRISSQATRRFTSAAGSRLSWASGASNQFSINDAASGGIVGDNSGSFYASEFIMYNTTFSDLDLARVNSYMSLKYGATMSQNLDGDATANEIISGSIREGDYVASDGSTVIWTANSTYDSCIAGIGRDDLSDLNQKQSKSIISGNQVVVSLGAAQATNALNTNTFTSDNQFLVWAHDGASDSAVVATGNTSYPYRFSRIWKAQNTGSFAQDIFVYYPVRAFQNASSSSVGLLYGSSAASLSSGAATVITQSGTTTIGGVSYYQFAVPAAQVPGIQFFSFSGTITSPGGVLPKLGLWYKADAGVTTSTGQVTQWDNYSGSGLYNLGNVGVTATRPLHAIDTGYINFNPTVSFDGTDDALAASSVPTSVINAGASTYGNAQFIVYRNKSTATGFMFQHNNNAIMASGSATLIPVQFANRASNVIGAPVNQVRLQSIDGINSAPVAYLDGQSAATAFLGTAAITASETFRVGSATSGSSFSKTDIAEIIMYNDSLNTRRRRVETYLAIKYGIGLGFLASGSVNLDYQSSTGSVIWPASSVFNRGVFGIGRDDLSGLHQQISRSTSSNGLLDSLIISTDNNFTNPNGSHNAIANDTSYLIAGNNAGSLSVATPLSGISTLNVRTGRVWKVRETGTVGTVNLLLKGTEATHMIYSNDSTFASGVSSVAMSGGSASYNFPTGTTYIAFAQYKQGPGGVVNNLKLWLRADAGTSTTTDGGAVTTWADQSGLGRDAGNANLASFRSGTHTKAINFNPVVDFDNTASRMYNITGGLVSATGARLHSFLITNVPSGAVSSQKIFAGYNNTLGLTNNAEAPSFRPTNTAYTTGSGFVTIAYNPSVVNTKAMLSLSLDPTSSTVSLRQSGLETGSLAGVSRSGINGYVLGNDQFDGLGDNPSALSAVGEAIAYEDKLTGKSLTAVESYLGIKYGMTLGNRANPVSYLASDTNIITWPASTTYQNNVFGLGRDSISSLHQQIARSVNPGDSLILSTDNNMTNANGAHTAITRDTSYLIVGNDSASLTSFITTEKPAGYSIRLPREWRTRVTNFTQTVNLRFAGFGSTASYEWYLVKKNGSSDFSTGVTEVAKLNANGDVTGITLNNDDYFTLMRKNLIDCIMVNPRVTNRLKVP